MHAGFKRQQRKYIKMIKISLLIPSQSLYIVNHPQSLNAMGTINKVIQAKMMVLMDILKKTLILSKHI